MKLPESPSFDELQELARLDPEAFEHWRTREIERIIEATPPHLRRRLQGMQFQIDAQRQLHPNPLGACVKISAMMHSAANELGHLLNEFSGQSHPNLPAAADADAPRVDGRRRAEVIEFRRR